MTAVTATATHILRYITSPSMSSNSSSGAPMLRATTLTSDFDFDLGLAASVDMVGSVSLELRTYFVNDSDSLLMGSNSSNMQTNATDKNLTGFALPNATMDANSNATEEIPSPEEIMLLMQMIAMSLVLGLMILITIIGNVFVIAAIILERNLQNVANYLVVSLAVADLFVACLVMPLGAVYEISDGWILGPELCDIWTSCDVLCCTASILHLVAIAADRYWTVTNIDYNNLRTPRRVFFMIFCVWFAALIVSLAPQFGWKDPEYMQRIEEQTCMVSQDVAYQIFATCSTFYVPLLVILFLYWKIYKIARKRIQRRTQKPFAVTLNETECDSTTQQQQQEQQKGKQGKQQQMQNRKEKRLKICFGSVAASASAGQRTGTGEEKDGGGVTTRTTADGIRSAGAEVAAVAAVAATLGDKKFTLGVNIETIAADFASLAITREETEFSTSNYDNKSHAGTEVTTVSSDADDFRTTSASEILTLSHQVATAAHQQHLIASHLNAITPMTQPMAFATGSGGQATGRVGGGGGGSTIASIVNPHQKLAKRRQLLEAKRERKAAQTLAIITGAFVVCWLPFFVMALLLSLCKNCSIHPAVASLFLWLGYFNSTLNPIIYTIFNPEFRRAFQRIIYGRKHAARCRSAKI